MKSVQVSVDYPAKLSRGILLLKTFLGWLICIPHLVCLVVLALVALVLLLISWFAVLFTGKYPRSCFDFIIGVQDWGLRVGAYLSYLRDEYPTFGLKASYPSSFNVTYPEKLSRGKLILRLFFGIFYILIPHGFCLYFRLIGHVCVAFVAWWAILFTGKIPESMFRFILGTFRWGLNLRAYWIFMTDEYPPFSGKPDQAVGIAAGVTA